MSAVQLVDHGAVWQLELARPDALNALNAAMRDELWEQLSAARDAGVGIALQGRGRAFCAGGDLGEFGQERDGARAHLTRQLRSLPWLCVALSSRLAVGVHGACYGAGLELAAFAQHLVCDQSARFCLPELRMGLIPGSGGTLSVPLRIGRRRTLELCLSGAAIDAEEALAIGLVDEIAPPGSAGARALSQAKRIAASSGERPQRATRPTTPR